MRTLLGMQYGGNVPQQYPRQQIPPQQFQEGGDVPAGLASLRRLSKKRKARDVFGETQTEQVGKRKSGDFWGSLLALGGGAGAAWLTPLLFSNPVTAAAVLPFLVGAGTGAGKYFGEKAGYGEEQDIDMDMMYAKEAGLGDIEQAGEDYQSDMWKRAALSGVKSGLMAGFAPKAGNIFKRIAGRGAPAIPGAGTITPDFIKPSYEDIFLPQSRQYWQDPLIAQEGGMINQQPQSLLSYLTR